MKHINIDKPRDLIIVEHMPDTKTILPGTTMYCGCCGIELGTTNNKLVFPFDTNTLQAAMEYTTFSITGLGLHHNICKRNMFAFKKGFDFITHDVYKQKFFK